MKKRTLFHAKLILLSGLAFLVGSCSLVGLDMQEDYDYNKQTLDPHINITAKQFLENRSYGSVPNDTVFKWMRKGLEYAEIDLAEYEKPGRTFLFLHNEGVRVLETKKGVTKTIAGLWFDFPIVEKDANGNPIFLDANKTIPKTRPATKWEDYPKADVRNYFLYLILQGDYNFDKLTIVNTAAQTLLPPNTTATKTSLLGYLNQGKGFDQEGKMNLKLVNNNDLAPIEINDKTYNRSGGYIATNGVVHVYGMKSHYTIYPFRE